MPAALAGVTVQAREQQLCGELPDGARVLEQAQHRLLDQAHLGARQVGEVLEVIKKARKNGLGVVFIPHTLPHVQQVTERVLVLRLGKVVRDAPTSDLDADSLRGTITGLVETV